MKEDKTTLTKIIIEVIPLDLSLISYLRKMADEIEEERNAYNSEMYMNLNNEINKLKQ